MLKNLIILIPECSCREQSILLLANGFAQALRRTIFTSMKLLTVFLAALLALLSHAANEGDMYQFSGTAIRGLGSTAPRTYSSGVSAAENDIFVVDRYAGIYGVIPPQVFGPQSYQPVGTYLQFSANDIPISIALNYWVAGNFTASSPESGTYWEHLIALSTSGVQHIKKWNYNGYRNDQQGAPWVSASLSPWVGGGASAPQFTSSTHRLSVNLPPLKQIIISADKTVYAVAQGYVILKVKGDDVFRFACAGGGHDNGLGNTATCVVNGGLALDPTEQFMLATQDNNLRGISTTVAPGFEYSSQVTDVAGNKDQAGTVDGVGNHRHCCNLKQRSGVRDSSSSLSDGPERDP